MKSVTIQSFIHHTDSSCSIMADHPPPQPVDPTVDPYSYLNFHRNPDGSVSRLPSPFPNTPATPNPDPSSSVLTKDFPINQSNKTWLRLFVPRQALDYSPTCKLPLIVYYHGGGFIMLSAASTMLHSYCTTVAAGIPAVIASVEYRLAPEHRLPAAYDDAVEALHWIKSTEEELFTNHVDFSNCFLMGESAGANIAYHVGLRAAAVDLILPMKIKGLILYHPFFGGTERTQSEIRLVDDKVLPPCVCDIMWELGLPAGVDRDHEYCNPTVNGGSDLCDAIRDLGWKVLVTGCDGDPLIDRQVDFAKMLERKGVQVVSKFVKGEHHGAEIVNPSKTGSWVLVLKEFVSSALTN